MQTYIISSKNIELGKDSALKIIQAEKVSQFDIETLEFEKALGIPDVRQIQSKIFLKPFKSDKKALIVVLFSGATVEAQNSMLKLLEEPPPSSLIFLITNNAQIFLPTILSRCKLIEIKSEEAQTNNDGLKEILSISEVGDQLHLAQIVAKEKEDAIIWLEQTILAARESMLENIENKQEALKLRKLIHKLELTHYDLKNTNVNPRLSLENLFLSL